MTPTEVFQTASIVVAVAALMLNAWFSWKRYKHDASSRNVSASVGLLKEWRAMEMREAEIFVLSELRAKYDSTLGFINIPGDDQKKALAISHLCDEISMRVIFGEANDEVIFTSLGDQMLALWNALEPYIQAERKFRSFPAYQRYFEALATKAKSIDITAIRERNTHAFLQRRLQPFLARGPCTSPRK